MYEPARIGENAAKLTDIFSMRSTIYPLPCEEKVLMALALCSIISK